MNLILLFVFLYLVASQPAELLGLVGTWKSSNNCQTLCMISLPKPPDLNSTLGENDIFKLLTFGKLEETLIFSLRSNEPIVNPGANGADQRVWVLEYKQSVIDTVSGHLQHEELGSFTFEVGTKKIWRNALVPHGVSMISEGQLIGPIPLTDLSGLANGVNVDCGPSASLMDSKINTLFDKNFEDCPTIPIRFPAISVNVENTNRTFIDTTVYQFETDAQAKNFPFLEENFGQEKIRSTFWLNSFMRNGVKKFQLQYVEVVSFLFGRIKVGDRTSGVVSWPHMIASTMDKVEPDACDIFSMPSDIKIDPTPGGKRTAE